MALQSNDTPNYRAEILATANSYLHDKYKQLHGCMAHTLILSADHILKAASTNTNKTGSLYK